MENNNEILHELQQVSPFLIELKGKNPYKVSSSYFTDFAGTTSSKIQLLEERIFNFTKENPYSVPPGYFENLQATIVQKVKQDGFKNEVFDEMEAISPLLNKISKKPIYSVPDGYLNKVELDKVLTVKRKASVLSIVRGSRIFTYAAAAVVAAVLATGAFLFTDKKDVTHQADTAQATSGVKQLSEEEILDFLKTTAPAENIVTVTNKANVKDNDINASLSTVSDKEIQQFLKENGDQDEM